MSLLQIPSHFEVLGGSDVNIQLGGAHSPMYTSPYALITDGLKQKENS